jgi:hypothetical protein
MTMTPWFLASIVVALCTASFHRRAYLAWKRLAAYFEVTARFLIKIPKPLIMISIASGAMCNTKHTPLQVKSGNAVPRNKVIRTLGPRQRLFSLRGVPSLFRCGGIRSPNWLPRFSDR